MLGELKIIDEFADKFDFRMFGPALLEKAAPKSIKAALSHLSDGVQVKFKII